MDTSPKIEVLTPGNLHGTLWSNRISAVITTNRLRTFADALSNASIAGFPLPLVQLLLKLRCVLLGTRMVSGIVLR